MTEIVHRTLPLGDGPPRRAPQTTAAWPQQHTRCEGCGCTITTWRNPNRAGREMPVWRPIVRCAQCTLRLVQRLRAHRSTP